MESLEIQLWDIYSAFVEYVVYNPNWEVEDEIDVVDFSLQVDHLLEDLYIVWFTHTKKRQRFC